MAISLVLEKIEKAKKTRSTTTVNLQHLKIKSMISV